MAEQAVLQAILKLKDELSSELKRVVGKAKTETDKATAATKSWSESLFSIRGALAAIGGFAAFRFVKDAVKGFAELERQTVSLEIALQGMGKAAALPQIVKLSKDIEGLGIAQEEEVLAAAKVLSTNNKISAELLPRATRAAVSLAAVMGTDVVSAARSMTQAFASGSEGIRGTGIRFDEASAKAGDIAKMLESVERVGGKAMERLSQTTSAKLAAMGSMWDDFKKKLGAIFVSVAEGAAKVPSALAAPAATPRLPTGDPTGAEAHRAALAAFGEAIQGMADAYEKLSVAQKEMFNSGRLSMEQMVNMLNEARGAQASLAETSHITAQEWAAAGERMKLSGEQQIIVWQALPDNFKRAATAMQGQKDQFVSALSSMGGEIRQFNDLSVTQLAKAWESAGGSATAFAQRLREDLAPAFRAVSDAEQEVTAQAEMTGRRRQEAIESWDAYWADVGDLTVKSMEFMKTVVESFASGIANVVGELFDKLWEGQIKTAKDFKDALEDMLRDLIKAIIKEMLRLIVQYAVLAAASAVFGAKGGIFEGGWTPVRKFAAGGVVTEPTVGVFGEGGNAEAVVPLPDNRSIPVKLVNGELGRQGDTYEVYISAVDGPSLQAMLSSDAGRDAIDAGIFRSIRRRSLAGRAMGGA